MCFPNQSIVTLQFLGCKSCVDNLDQPVNVSPLWIWRSFNDRIYRLWNYFRNSTSKRPHFVNDKYFVVNFLRWFFIRKGCSPNPTFNRNTFEEDLYFNFFHTIRLFHKRCFYLADCVILRGRFMKTILAISKFHNVSPKMKCPFAWFPNKTAYQFIPKITMNCYFNKEITQIYWNSSSLYSFLYIWCIIYEHIEKTANAVTSFKNTKQF